MTCLLVLLFALFGAVTGLILTQTLFKATGWLDEFSPVEWVLFQVMSAGMSALCSGFCGGIALQTGHSALSALFVVAGGFTVPLLALGFYTALACLARLCKCLWCFLRICSRVSDRLAGWSQSLAAFFRAKRK